MAPQHRGPISPDAVLLVCHHVRDRGRLEPGAVADVVLFNPATIADTATFTEPHRYPRGISWVLVNGEPVIAGGQHSGSRPESGLAR